MSGKVKLLDDSSDSEVELTINKNYADKYDHWRNKEELQKYKDLMKEDSDSSSSSESDEVPDVFDEEFFRALSLVKGKDPRIYDKNFTLFKEKETPKKEKVAKEKPMYLKDYERNFVLEAQGKFDDEEELVDDEDELVHSEDPTYDEEQKKLKESFKAALVDSDDDNENLLQVRKKTKEEEDTEESDYLKWLKGEKEEVREDVKKDMSYLRRYWNDPNLDEGEKFLRDYILNKRYLEKDDKEIPTYEEITSGVLSDDERMIDQQEKFEHKYNFRFEEPDEEFIKRYPRTIGDSLRRVDTRRKQKREEITDRKKKEKEQRREELKRLKALKRREIEEKFMKLKEVSGYNDINFNEEDIESDFDPEKHDKKMQELFNDDYYQVEEEQKPEFPFDEELDSENWNNWAGERFDQEGADEAGNDICDEENVSQQGNIKTEIKANKKDQFEKEIIESTQGRQKHKKKSLFAKVISQPKPVYDPDGKSFEDYLDEYYKLDYEDVVGDLPVRFKYRKVVPNDFGLSVEEILLANDKELNRWCSVKKACQYRNADEEYYDVQAFKKKAQNQKLKEKIFHSLYAKDDDNETEASNTGVTNLKSKKKKKLRGKDGNIDKLDADNKIEGDHSLETVDETENSSKIEDDKLNTLESDAINNIKLKSRKRKRKIKYNITNTEVHISTDEANVVNKDTSFESSGKCKVSSSTKKKMKKSDINKDEQLKSNDYVIEQNVEKIEHIESDEAEHFVKVESNSNEIATVNGRKKKAKKKKKPGNMDHVSNFQNDNHSSNISKHKFSERNININDKRLALSDDRLSAYGINPKKFKKRLVYSKKQNS